MFFRWGIDYQEGLVVPVEHIWAGLIPSSFKSCSSNRCHWFMVYQLCASQAFLMLFNLTPINLYCLFSSFCGLRNWGSEKLNYLSLLPPLHLSPSFESRSESKAPKLYTLSFYRVYKTEWNACQSNPRSLYCEVFWLLIVYNVINYLNSFQWWWIFAVSYYWARLTHLDNKFLQTTAQIYILYVWMSLSMFY